MALPTNTYTRYTAGTNVREDLIDKITRVDPDETPIISAAGRDTATSNYHEWQRDTLRAANKDNAALDGDDATASAKTPPQRVANYLQIFQDTITVSGRAEKVKKAGMTSAMAYLKAKAYKEIKKDMEAMVLSANPAVAGSAGVAPKSAGLGTLIYTNVSHGAGGSTVAHTSGAATVAPTAGTGRAFSQTLLDTAVQAAYIASGKVPPRVFVSPAHKRVFSGFTGIAANRYDIKGKNDQGRVQAGADLYGSDFGALEIVPHYLMAGSTTVYGLNTDYIDMVYMKDRAFVDHDLAKTGDNTKLQILSDVTLRVTSETAQFAIKDLTGG